MEGDTMHQFISEQMVGETNWSVRHLIFSSTFKFVNLPNNFVNCPKLENMQNMKIKNKEVGVDL